MFIGPEKTDTDQSQIPSDDGLVLLQDLQAAQGGLVITHDVTHHSLLPLTIVQACYTSCSIFFFKAVGSWAIVKSAQFYCRNAVIDPQQHFQSDL